VGGSKREFKKDVHVGIIIISDTQADADCLAKKRSICFCFSVEAEFVPCKGIEGEVGACCGGWIVVR
jgi:hypothetical protein